jgi:hypothetical protein
MRLFCEVGEACCQTGGICYGERAPLSLGITTWTYIVGGIIASITVVPILLLIFQRDSPDESDPTTDVHDTSNRPADTM